MDDTGGTHVFDVGIMRRERVEQRSIPRLGVSLPHFDPVVN